MVWRRNRQFCHSVPDGRPTMVGDRVQEPGWTCAGDISALPVQKEEREGSLRRTPAHSLRSIDVGHRQGTSFGKTPKMLFLLQIFSLLTYATSHAPGSSSLPAVQAARTSRRMRKVGRGPGRRASARQPPTSRAPSLQPRRSKGAGTSRKRCRAPGLKRRHKRVARRPKPEPPHRESLACERGGRCGT